MSQREQAARGSRKPESARTFPPNQMERLVAIAVVIMATKLHVLSSKCDRRERNVEEQLFTTKERFFTLSCPEKTLSQDQHFPHEAGSLLW